MAQVRLIALVLAAAELAGCSDPAPPDPCARTAGGAPWLAFASGRGASWDVQVARADGSCRRAIATDAAWDGAPAWGANGVLAYESDRPPRTSVWLHALHEGSERRLDVGELLAMSPAFSPDGSRIAFEGRVPGASESAIYVVPSAGGAPVLLTPERVPHRNGLPSFSPDGASVYFVSNRGGAYEVYRAPVEGAIDPEKVTTSSGIQGRPAISPDGKTLAYTRLGGGSTVVVLEPMFSGSATPLGVADAADPAFDPAGGRLAVRVLTDLGAAVELVPLPGAAGAPVAVTDGTTTDGTPAFDRLGY